MVAKRTHVWLPRERTYGFSQKHTQNIKIHIVCRKCCVAVRSAAQICADLRGSARICANLRESARICANLRGEPHEDTYACTLKPRIVLLSEWPRVCLGFRICFRICLRICFRICLGFPSQMVKNRNRLAVRQCIRLHVMLFVRLCMHGFAFAVVHPRFCIHCCAFLIVHAWFYLHGCSFPVH